MFDTIRYVLWRLWLWLVRNDRQDRFMKLIDWQSKDPFKYGALTTATEREYELPKVNLTHCDDVIDFFLQNSKQQIVFARISRLGNGIASMCFYIRLSGNRSWKCESVVVDQTTEDSYRAGGLRIDVIHSMRAYRMSFNGIAYNSLNESMEHLRAIFIGNFIHGCGDYRVFHDEHFLAKQLPLGASLKCLNEIDVYVQTFSMTGKIYVDSLEEEVHLWGYRRKQRLDRRDDPPPVELTTRLTAYTKNGLGLDVNEARVKDVSTNTIMFGHLNYPAFQQRPIQSCSVNSISGRKTFRIGAAQFKELKLSITRTIDEIFWTQPTDRGWHRFSAKLVRISYDGNEGHGLLTSSSEAVPVENVPLAYVSPYVHLLGQLDNNCTSERHVVQFSTAACRSEALTGGKGSSLAVLTDISTRYEHLFKVPKGVCVTTRAYREFVSSSESREAIGKLITLCGTLPSNEDLQRHCEQTRRIVASAPLANESLKQIRFELENLFGSAASSTRFAVRSSACGEDSENMSAAGQMETLLGIVGFEALAEAIAKCWASQFAFVAVQYKRRYGQLIDADMCVVVQQMVASDVSGVMFTVDPITANPLSMSVTANYGLGESVVSASADPDTFTVSRQANGNLSIKTVHLGQKKLATVMKEAGGTEDVEGLDRSTEQTLTNEQLVELAKIGLILEREYASPRDTEWALYDGEFYLLQARPITSIDNIDTEFEFFHEADAALVGEFDSITKANVGEVFGGSISTLTQSVFALTLLDEKIDAKKQGLDSGQHPYARESFFVTQNSQFFFHTFSAMGDFASADLANRGFSIAMAGRIVNDEIVTRSSANKTKYLCNDTPRPGLLKLLKAFWTTAKSIDTMENIITAYSPKALKKHKIRDIFLQTLEDPQFFSNATGAHVEAIVYGSLSNVAFLSLLANADGGFTINVFRDFASLVSSCNDVVSAGVPQMLQKIAYVINQDYGKKFADLHPDLALKMLQTENTNSAIMFGEFIQSHGHRCLNEFDLVTRTWSMEPLYVVKTLQTMVSTDSGSLGNREELDIDRILNEMTIKLSWWKRQILKQILYRVRKGIALRERAKSCLILALHQFRKSFRHLAQRMVEEGRIPDEDLLFFFIPDELLNFIETRDPRFIVRAMNRMKNAKAAAKHVYPEILACPPFIPLNLEKVSMVPCTGTRSITGTPVSRGRVVASARVITRLEDAHLIQKGDVLITYATDIGWSPYFPLISGIVTELGGLISHGAVVAREYGIPCIVGCHGATHLFKSGEEVLLDGNEGLIATTSETE